MSYKTKKRWKGIIAAVLVIGALIAACAGLAVISKNDTQKIRASAFSRGDLDDTGIYVESDKSIYTKEAFRCTGLRVEPDFESQVTYDVYYYDYDLDFVEAKKGLSDVYDEDYPPLASYARIVIHPEESDSKDFKIHFYEVVKYANDLTITVDKNQDFLYDMNNLYIDDNSESGKSFNYGDDNETLTIFESNVQKISERIPVHYENYDIYIRWTTEFMDYSAAVVVTSEDKVIERVNKNMLGEKAGEWVKLELSLESIEENYDLIVKLPIDAECYIFGYND